MKTYHTLALKELKKQKVTSILILIAIILSTVMTTVIGQSIGILKAMQIHQASYLSGDLYATFQALNKTQIEELRNDSRITSLSRFIQLGNTKLQNSGISLTLIEYDNKGIEAHPAVFQIINGSFPQTAGEIALSKNTLELLEFTGDIGDTITLNLNVSLLRDDDVPYEYTSTFKLCGILVDNYLGYSSGLVAGIAGQGTADLLLPPKYLLYSADFITANKQEFQNIVTDLANKINISDDYIRYNWLYLDALGIDYDRQEEQIDNSSGISYMIITGFLIGTLVLLAAGLVIYNILKISISKRISEYGTLRAIGAKKGQLYLLVALQLLLLCIIGIPIGSIFGILSADFITKAATSSFNPDIFMTQNTEELMSLISQNSTVKHIPLMISDAITLFFAFISTMPAAHYAATVSPVSVINHTTAKVKRKHRKDKHIRYFEAFYARLNLKRNAGRTGITILSLVMSITVYVALQSFSGLLDNSQAVQKLRLGDYSISNDLIGFEPSIVENLRSQKGISSLFTLKYSLYQQEADGTIPIKTNFKLKPSETLQILGVDEERLKVLMSSLSNTEIQALKDGNACLIKNPIAMSFDGMQMEASSFVAGDIISVSDTDLTVLGNCDAVRLNNEGFVNGIQVIVFDTVYDKLTGKTAYSELYPVLTNDANIQMIEEEIIAICNQVTGSNWISYQNTDRQLEESSQQIKLLAWGLILFIGLIGLLNIINTTYTSVHTRVNEIGMQRAMGMSTKSLYKTFLWEGAYYGIISSIIGSITGYVSTIFVEAAATDQLKLVVFPFTSIFYATIISISVCLITTSFPLRQIAKISIVDSIRTIE